MKFTKKQWSNGLLIIAVAVLLFTPLGFQLKVAINRLFAGSASMVKEGLQTPLDTYQWQLVDREGAISDFKTQKGKVVLINFWATWCPPCVAEMPSMQKLYDGYGDKMAFMFVTTEDPKKVEAFMERHHYTLPIFYPRTEGPKALESKLLPTTYVIDREGRIRVAETGAADWNSDRTRTLLDGLLKE
ncbi:MAG: TlpA disulfide reductase family protein [Sediminicola sp.]